MTAPQQTGLGNPQAQPQSFDWTIRQPDRRNPGPMIAGGIVVAALIGALAAIWVNDNPHSAPSTSTVTTITGEDQQTRDFKADQAEKERANRLEIAKVPQRQVITTQVDEAKPPKPAELLTDTKDYNWESINDSEREFVYHGDPVEVQKLPDGMQLRKVSNPMLFVPGQPVTVQGGDTVLIYAGGEFASGKNN